MFLRIFLLLALVVVLALFARALLLGFRFRRDIKTEEQDLRLYLKKLVEEEVEKKDKKTKDALPCTVCGVALLEEEGVRDEEGRFFCSTVHLESFHQQPK